MSEKMDRQGVRTPADVERKYNFGKTFAEVFSLVDEAQKTAEEAKTATDGLDQDAIFNLLTNNGAFKGIYRDEDGEIYINASYIKSGKFTSSVMMFIEPGMTEAEVILKHLSETELIPPSRIPLYDFDGDGEIGIYDAMLASQAAYGLTSLKDWSGAQKTEIALTIDPADVEHPIRFTGSNMWGMTFDKYIGFNDAFLKATESGSMYRENAGETEWVNPPFTPGVEYRTTERLNDVAVYKKLDAATNRIMWRTATDDFWRCEVPKVGTAEYYAFDSMYGVAVLDMASKTGFFTCGGDVTVGDEEHGLIIPIFAGLVVSSCNIRVGNDTYTYVAGGSFDENGAISIDSMAMTSGTVHHVSGEFIFE